MMTKQQGRHDHRSEHEMAIYTVGPLEIENDPERAERITSIVRNLSFDEAKIDRIRDVFIQEMDRALNEEPSSLQMENTYIPELIDGTEEGIFLALDLGGTNFRVVLLQLHSSNIVREEVQHYQIAEDLRIGCGDRLFRFLAECVDDFVRTHDLERIERIPLGFTFSFPMRQHSLDSGVLITWTKSFNCPSTVGQDAVANLRQALRQCGRENIDVLAILNDTTGTLIQGARLDAKTRIGIVLGTGTNGAYMERADRVKHWETQRHGEHHVVIDIEWGAFGDNGVLDFIRTEFDRAVDDGSLLKKSFTYEKYIGGKYLGELCRTILKRLFDEKLLFIGADPTKLPQPWQFGSNNVSKIECDAVNDTRETVNVLENLGYCYGRDFDEVDIRIVRHVCGLISRRAAQLLAINIAALLNRMDETEVTIAIDGSVYKHHPRLRYWIKWYTDQWASRTTTKFILAEDGSGKGAALVAAIAKRIAGRNCE